MGHIVLMLSSRLYYGQYNGVVLALVEKVLLAKSNMPLTWLIIVGIQVFRQNDIKNIRRSKRTI
jgi:hypothetical protein